MNRYSTDDIEIIRKSDLFDSNWYLDQYPDVRALGMDPAEHYLWLGAKLGRNPSPKFDSAAYLSANLDVAIAAVNPLLHYVRSGQYENRLASGFLRPSQPAAGQDAAAAESGADDEVGEFFHTEFYRRQVPNVGGSRKNLLNHYMKIGWRDFHDPSRLFSTKYYLDNNKDIREAGINPLMHYLNAGRAEGRHALPFSARLFTKQYRPLVSAIIPNFNHARFLRQRIESVLNQTYQNLEIIILDDCSTDNSHEIIEEYFRKFPDKIRYFKNRTNAGSVFKQWRHGVSLANGELLWICESDDYCELDFLKNIVTEFADESQMIVFGRIQFCDSNGEFIPGLDQYREQAIPGIWKNIHSFSAAEWFRSGFGVSNLIPNVGGCVIRNQDIQSEIWEQAEEYKILGDWYLYIRLSQGGRMTYVPDAVSYFRQHGENASVKSFVTEYYYREHHSLMMLLRELWGPQAELVERFYKRIEFEYKRVNGEKYMGELKQYADISRALAVDRKGKHIFIAILGFTLGGGEIFPINLANSLLKKGYIVSVMVLRSEVTNQEVRNRLDNRIAVYDSHLLFEKIGISAFVEDLGVDLIHSHCIDVDHYFFNKNCLKFDVPYIVTNHGSYECTNIGSDDVGRITGSVSHWVYLSKKNLMHLRTHRNTTFIKNGVPRPVGLNNLRRSDFGVSEEAMVFTIASRAIPEKGWECAIRAMLAAQKTIDRELVLLLCGDGPEAERLELAYADVPRVKFLGFRGDVAGIYRMSDCALLPSRFKGESFPLALIEALQVETPIISTDLGEIRKIVLDKGLSAGIIVEPSDDDDKFVADLAHAIQRMTDDRFRRQCQAAALELGDQYSMEAVADEYAALYERMIKRGG